MEYKFDKWMQQGNSVMIIFFCVFLTLVTIGASPTTNVVTFLGDLPNLTSPPSQAPWRTCL
jgi:hypothetical protein